MKEQAKNCRNCGAPLNECGDCEYCGTKSPREWNSWLEITPYSIKLNVDQRSIGNMIEKHMGT